MALEDRAFNWETSDAFLTNANGGSPIVAPIFQFFRRITIRIECEMMEAEVAMDPALTADAWRFPRPRQRSWSVDIEGVVDKANNSGALYNLFTWASNLADGDGLFTYKGPVGAGGNRFRFEGPVVFDTSDISYGGEEAIQTLRLIGYGKPTTNIVDTS